VATGKEILTMQQDRTGWVQRQVGSQEAEPAAGPDRRQEQTGGHKTFVFQGAEFEGTLRLRESFHIDSEFRGEIVSEGTVTVGEAAGVEATIRARNVIIGGAVVGNVSASRQLVIHAGGRLHGDVETPCLEVEKGAVFNGRITMVRPEVAARANPRGQRRDEGADARTASATALPQTQTSAPQA
jgi:cytoskeletal protein CcmA (bactofilin family)